MRGLGPGTLPAEWPKGQVQTWCLSLGLGSGCCLLVCLGDSILVSAVVTLLASLPLVLAGSVTDYLEGCWHSQGAKVKTLRYDLLDLHLFSLSNLLRDS